MNRHVRIAHKKVKIAECDLCKVQFNTEDSKKRHMKAKHDGINFNCKKCVKEFVYKASLGKHVKNYHVDWIDWMDYYKE